MMLPVELTNFTAVDDDAARPSRVITVEITGPSTHKIQYSLYIGLHSTYIYWP